MKGNDVGALLKQDRGQFVDFVSAHEYKRSGGRPKSSDELCREIARIASGMANADGGTILVGVESDRSVTGIPHPPDEIHVLVNAPQNLLLPPLHPASERIHLGNLLLLKFDIPPSPEVHRLSGGRSFYRIASENPSISPERIQAMRAGKKSFHYERQTVPDAAWEDLDQEAIEAFAQKIQDPRDPRSILRQPYHLVDGPMEQPTITMAALLLFGKNPARWHPRCGIDFVKYEGSERQYGGALNVIKRIRFEVPLCRLIDEAVGRIKEQVPERTILHDLFFQERLEYPTFAWQEAVVNAVAHRDYGLDGASTEVWMFEDRIEVRSPGLLPPPVTLDQLRAQQKVHFSRNPLLVRALTDLGYLREMGEGIPRIFQEMDHHGLRPPEFSDEGFFFAVTLRNTPVYDEATLRWLNQFGASTMNIRQRRLLAYAYSHGKAFSTADYQRVGEIDRDTAYREIRAMVKLGIVGPLKPKSRSYRIIEKL